MKSRGRFPRTSDGSKPRRSLTFGLAYVYRPSASVSQIQSGIASTSERSRCSLLNSAFSASLRRVMSVQTRHHRIREFVPRPEERLGVDGDPPPVPPEGRPEPEDGVRARLSGQEGDAGRGIPPGRMRSRLHGSGRRLPFSYGHPSVRRGEARVLASAPGSSCSMRPGRREP